MALKFLNDGYFAGKVGIGVEAPTYTLELQVSQPDENPVVYSQFGGNNGVTGNSFLQIGGARGSAASERYSYLQTLDGAGGFRILSLNPSGGNVGIGTTSPTATLDVHAPSTTAPSLTMGAAAGQIFKNEDSELAFGLMNASPYNAWMQSRFNGNVARPFVINPLGGNVGIGTTSPTRKLHVNGDVQVDTNLVVNSGIYNTTYYAGSSTATYFKNSVASDTLTILESGNVGIGVTNPLDKLHVDGRVRTSSSGVAIGDTNAVIYRNSNDLELITYGGYDINLMPSGNVGIGTITPSQKLHVAGNLRVTGAYYDSNNSPGTANQVLVSTATGTDWVDGSGSSIIGGPYLPLTAGASYPLTGTLYGTSTNFSGSATYAGSMILGNGASTAEANLQIGQGRTGNGYSYIDLIGDATYTDYGLRIIRSNTGENTTSGIYHRGTGNLEIQATDSASILLKTNNTLALTLNASQNAIFTGNVGIATTIPQEKFVVNAGAITAIASDGAYTAGYFAKLSSDHGVNALKLTSRSGDVLRATDYGSSVTILTGGTTSASVFISSNKAVQFNGYNSTNFIGTPTYLLGTDASGNVVKTNTVPGSGAGPYLPLAGGTMTGTNGVLMPDNFKLKFGDATTPDLEIYHDGK